MSSREIDLYEEVLQAGGELTGAINDLENDLKKFLNDFKKQIDPAVTGDLRTLFNEHEAALTGSIKAHETELEKKLQLHVDEVRNVVKPFSDVTRKYVGTMFLAGAVISLLAGVFFGMAFNYAPILKAVNADLKIQSEALAKKDAELDARSKQLEEDEKAVKNAAALVKNITLHKPEKFDQNDVKLASGDPKAKAGRYASITMPKSAVFGAYYESPETAKDPDNPNLVILLKK